MDVILLTIFLFLLSGVCENNDALEPRFMLKIVEKITNPFTDDAPLYRIDTSTFVDTTEVTDEVRSFMCEEALYLDRLKNRRFTVHDDLFPEEEKLYVLYTELGDTLSSDQTLLPELVFAFKCPTFPRIYLQFYDDKKYFGRVVWVILESRTLPPELSYYTFGGYVSTTQRKGTVATLAEIMEEQDLLPKKILRRNSFS